jgi:hypothetical protein
MRAFQRGFVVDGHAANRVFCHSPERPAREDLFQGRFTLLREEVDSKQRKRVQMGLTIAHFPQAHTLEDFDFRFQPSVDQRLVKERSTGRFIALSDNVLILGPPGNGGDRRAMEFAEIMPWHVS